MEHLNRSQFVNFSLELEGFFVKKKTRHFKRPGQNRQKPLLTTVHLVFYHMYQFNTGKHFTFYIPEARRTSFCLTMTGQLSDN